MQNNKKNIKAPHYWLYARGIHWRSSDSPTHYNDDIMSAIASQIASLTIVYAIVYSDADQRKHQSSASLAFVRGIRRGPVNSPHKWPVTRKMFPFDYVIMIWWILFADVGGFSSQTPSTAKSVFTLWRLMLPGPITNTRYTMLPWVLYYGWSPGMLWWKCKNQGTLLPI